MKAYASLEDKINKKRNAKFTVGEDKWIEEDIKPSVNNIGNSPINGTEEDFLTARTNVKLDVTKP